MKKIHKILLCTALLSAAPAFATDFSYTGTFRQDDNVAFFDFVATGTSTVTLRSFSYAAESIQPVRRSPLAGLIRS